MIAYRPVAYRPPFRVHLAQAPAAPPATVPKEPSFIQTSVVGIMAGALAGAALGVAFGFKEIITPATIGAGAGFVAANIAKLI